MASRDVAPEAITPPARRVWCPPARSPPGHVTPLATMSRPRVALAVLALVLVAAALRLAGSEQVFLGDDTVVFSFGDPYYQLRRGLFSFVSFPAVLQQDPYVAWPDGVGAPLPPLFHLLLAGAGRLFGDDVADFERAAALVGPVLGVLLLVPVLGATRLLAGPRTALAAGWLAAVLPVGVLSSAVGNADYHAFVTLLGAGWLWGVLAVLGAEPGRQATATRPSRAALGVRPPRRELGAHVGVLAARTALLATWPGSLLYLGLAEGTLTVGEALQGRGRSLAHHAAGLAVSALAIAWLVSVSGRPLGGPWSAIGLSWLHVSALVAATAVTSGLAVWEAWRPSRRIAERVARLVVIGAAASSAVLVSTPVTAGLLAAGSFVQGADRWVAGNSEALPLFRLDPEGRRVAPVLLGGFAYLLPLLPVALLLRARAATRPGPLLALAAWVTVLGVLAASQLRYASELLPSFCIAAALLASEAVAWLAPRLGRGVARAATAALVVTLTLPGFAVIHGPRARGSLRVATGSEAAGDRALALPVGTLVRFAEEVRRLTPETAGFVEAGDRPDYGVLCEPNLGHTLLYAGRRPTPAGNFGPYVGPERFAQTERFYAAGSESEALALLDALRTPWVVTAEFGVPKPGMKRRLHDLDGRGSAGSPRLEHFRLVTEGPAGGLPLGTLFGIPGRPGSPPYKLFQRVPGALLEVEAPVGEEVTAQTVVATPLGRRFLHRARAVAGADGVARLRLPYATDTDLPARPDGPWRLRVGGRGLDLEVPEAAVVAGRRIRVPAP